MSMSTAEGEEKCEDKLRTSLRRVTCVKTKSICFDPVVRTISVVHLSPRFISTIVSALEIDEPRTDLDSHADSPVVGVNAAINREVTVFGFSYNLGNMTKVPIVQAAITYDCQYTGKSYILHINNELYIKDMKVNLIPPFMMRLAGQEVNESPKFMAEYPTSFRVVKHWIKIWMNIRVILI